MALNWNAKLRNGVLALIGLCLAVAPAWGRAGSPPCAAPESHQMDFWLGDWDLTWQGGAGTNHITREFKDCVIHEHFAGDASVGDLRGESFSMFQPATKAWRQTWIDDQGSYIALTGGPRSDGSFLLETSRLDAKAARTRMIFEDIEPNSFVWRWQKSTDDGKTWADTWVINYKRKA